MKRFGDFFVVLGSALSILVFASTLDADVSGVELRDGELSPAVGAPLLPPETPAFEMVVYINGQNTSSQDAIRDAALIGGRVGCGVRLIFNDLTLPVIDWFSTAIEKTGNAESSVNAATKTLLRLIQTQIEKGERIFIIGHSAGSLSILNAVNAIARAYKDKSAEERRTLLSRIHVLTVGGAVFSSENTFADGWPNIGSTHHLWDSRDGVANVWGEGDFWDWFDCDMGDFHGMATHYAKYILPSMLWTQGISRIDEQHNK